MRIVIADDEYLVQETLISMIAEFGGDFSIAGVASDGNELVKMIQDHSPDLVIADIKMPYISGLEAIRHTKEEFPHMQWIVLTGYSEFTYAQEAIKLGVVNYLLKPVDRDELGSTLEKIKQAKKAQYDFINKKFESAMVSMVHGLDPGLLEEEGRDFAELYFSIAVFYMDSGLQENEQASRLRTFYRNTKDWMGKTDFADIRFAFIFLPNGELALIGAYQKKAANYKIWDRINSQMEEMLQKTSCNQFCLTMITSGRFPFTELQDEIDKIQNASMLRILYGVNKSWPLQRLLKYDDEQAHKLCRTILRLVKSFSEGSHANYINQANELKTILGAGDKFNGKEEKSQIAGYFLHTIRCKLDENNRPSDWVHKLKDHGEILLKQISKSERPNSIIQQALLFIENKYMHDTSIQQIADELQVTPNYLSTVFHKKMGTTIVKYLTRIRLIKAQELLRNPNIQVQAVAEMVGYMNPRYFARLFAEFTGCNPSDYKKMASRSDASL